MVDCGFSINGNGTIYQLTFVVLVKKIIEKYKLNGVEMFGDNTYIVEFNENEFQNWNRTKLMDQMLNEQTR